MHAILGLLRRQFLGAIALVVALAGVASGAAPKYLQLGASNDAPRTTVLRNTGAGPALTFSTRLTAPPFRVESRKLVPGLNAARLQGRNAQSFAAAGSSYTKSESDARYPSKTASYTRGESDARYLPKSASQGFMSANSFTLLSLMVEGEMGYVVGGTGNFVDHGLRAPAAGKIMMTAVGTCTSANNDTQGTLTVQVGGAENKSQTTFSSPEGVFCKLVSTKAVSVGESVPILATITDHGSSGALFKGIIAVEFIAS